MRLFTMVLVVVLMLACHAKSADLPIFSRLAPVPISCPGGSCPAPTMTTPMIQAVQHVAATPVHLVRNVVQASPVVVQANSQRRILFPRLRAMFDR